MESFLPAVLSIIHGCWSDKYGRKISMTISALGVSLSYMILFASTFFPTYCYTNLWVLLLPSIPKALGGGLPVFQMASFSYLGDILQQQEVKPNEKLYRFGAFLIIGQYQTLQDIASACLPASDEGFEQGTRLSNSHPQTCTCATH